MIKWKKPSGVIVETNEEKATIEAAESLGWKQEKAATKKPAAKKDDASEESDEK